MKKNSLDRKYVLAALLGLMHEEKPHKAFVVKYKITPKEFRLCARLRIQYLMKGTAEIGRVAVRKVNTLAKKHGFLAEELHEMAWEVLRGTVMAKCDRWEENERGETAFYVLKFFLVGKNKPVSRSPYCSEAGDTDFILGLADSDISYDKALLEDLVLQTLEATLAIIPEAELPKEIQELLQDVGLLDD